MWDVDYYVRRLSYNIKNYSCEMSLKKNKDMRRIVNESKNEERKAAMELAWKIVYKI